MSFQGLGTGISGTSNQFSVGYGQSAGYTTGNIGGYAPVAGNVQGYSPQAGYANQASATAQTLQVQGAGSATWGWQGQNTTPAWLWGSNQGTSETVFAPGNLTASYANSAGYAQGSVNQAAAAASYVQGTTTNAGYANQQGGYAQHLSIPYGGQSTWYWQGQAGYPGHYWGSNDGVNMYVWQFSQGYVGTAGYTSGTIQNQSAGYAGYANQCYGCNGGTNVAYYTQTGGANYTNQLSGACGFGRQGRNGAYGNYWGNGYAGYNQQGSSIYANFNVQYGSYFLMTSYFYGGNWNKSSVNWQGNSQCHMTGMNNSLFYSVIG